jgi:hypothetical protein
MDTELHYFNSLTIDGKVPSNLMAYKIEYDDLIQFCNENNIKVIESIGKGDSNILFGKTHEYSDDCTENASEVIKAKLKHLIASERHDFHNGNSYIKYTFYLKHMFVFEDSEHIGIKKYILADEFFSDKEIERLKPFCRCNYHTSKAWFSFLKPCAGCCGCLQYESHGSGTNQWLLQKTKKHYEITTGVKFH